MKSITFECETITPMFLAGADGQTPELRPPSIKGALRFWWRAMNGHLSLAELKKNESIIFGGTDSAGRSKLIIKVLNQPTFDNIKSDSPTPHKDRPFLKPSIKVGFNFKIQLNLIDNELFNIKSVGSLFEIFAVIGGLGNRSRRGFGAFRILKIDNNTYVQDDSVENIKILCHQITPYFKVNANYAIKYPYIKEFVPCTKDIKDLMKSIGDMTHKLNQKHGYNYGDALGKAKGGRFASPIYISTIQKLDGKLYPFITILNTVTPGGHYIKDIQEELIKSLS